jgi:hypothetical protein
MARALAMMLALGGCGSVDGYPCERDGAQQCDGRDVAFCETTALGGLKWVTYSCPSGCETLGPEDGQRCSWLGVVEGTPCPPARQGVGVCSADGEVTSCNVTTLAPGGVWRRSPCTLCLEGRPVEEVLRKVGDVYRCD